MRQNLKLLYKQVLVITGATSDIGAHTVRSAVEQGAKVFMIDMDEPALQVIQDEMRGKGYDTAYAVANPTEENQLQFAADRCIGTFGTIDTWVNIPSVLTSSKRKHFETHYWEMVNGCNVAIPLLQHGGVIINVASTYQTETIPDKHIDSASRQAVKGFTDALRKELHSLQTPISVSLIISSNADTVARGILHCAEVSTRQIGEATVVADRIWNSLIPIKLSRSNNYVASTIGGIAFAGGIFILLMRRFRLI